MINKFFFLFLASLLLRIIFSKLIPPFAANDEPAHLRYAQHILAEKKLPNANLYIDETMAGNEYYQPPAYYFLGSIFISTAREATNQLQTLRLLSIFFGAVGFYFAYKILKILKLPAWLSMSTLAFLALLPTYVVNSSTVTNDSLSVPLAIITIYYLLLFFNKGISYSQILILASLSSLTVLTKLNGFILLPTVLVALFYSKNRSLKTFFLKSSLYLGFTALLTGWWFLYNKQLYGDWMGPIEVATATFEKVPFGLQKIYLITRGTFATFWIAYGPANEIRLPIFVYGILFLFTILSLGGNITYAKRIYTKKIKLPFERRFIKVLLTALVSNLALHLAFNINQHQPLGRYLFLSLIQTAMIFSLGIGNFLPKKIRNYLPSALIGVFIVLNIWGALVLINYYK